MTYPPKEARAVSDTSKAAHYPDAHFHPYADDEISLVDLAKILIRRRWWVIGVAGVIFALALALAMVKKPAYEWVSVYQVAELKPGEAILEPAAVIQLINTIHWPAVRRQYLEEHDIEQMPFEVSVQNPSGTLIVTLRTDAPLEEQPVITAVHQSILEAVLEYQEQDYVRRIETLVRQIETTGTALTELESRATSDDANRLARLNDRLYELEDRQNALRPASVIQLSAQGERAGRVGGSLILALGLVLGGILGIMAAFFAEFGARVRQSLKEDQQV